MTASLDTNVLLRLVVPDLSDQHQRARALLATTGERFDAADHVIVEMVFVLDRHYGLDRDQIAPTVSGLIALDNIKCHHARLLTALDVWQEHPELSFEDRLVAQCATERDATPLWTFDHRLANQHPAARLVPVAVPDGEPG